MAMTKDSQHSMTPAEALASLKAGNERFRRGQAEGRDLMQQVNETSGGQYPFAVVLGCIDSRVPPELVFDLGVGDVFSARVAGNFVNGDILGSMEFACKVAGAKLVLVLGHSACGAVKGACDGVELGNLTGMLANIRPATEAVKEPSDPAQRTSANGEFVEAVCLENVKLTVEDIRRDSEILRDMESEGSIAIVGAKYDVGTGEVSFFD